jgi:hypothetical protein
VPREISESEVVEIDPKAKSIWLRGGKRLGFAEARRAGVDVEALMASPAFTAVQVLSTTTYIRS